MSACLKCGGYCTTLVVLLAIGISLYFKYGDQREFNYNTTADAAAADVDLTGQIIIVTGSNTGIGKPTTKVLLSHGATVIMACRNTQKALRARDDIIHQLSVNNFKNATKKDLESRLEFIPLDLASLRSVKTFSDIFQSKYDQLNQLILNAGIMALPQFQTTEDGIEKQFGVNHVAHHYLAKLLTPLLIRSASRSKIISRVISLSSEAHRHAPKPINAWLVNDSNVQDATQYGAFYNYGFSKACNVLFAMQYTSLYWKENVYAVSVHPGGVDTELGRHIDARILYVLEWLRPIAMMFIKTASQGAATSIRTAVISQQEFKQYSGGYFADCNIAKIRRDLLGIPNNKDENGKYPQLLLWEMTEKLLQRKLK